MLSIREGLLYRGTAHVLIDVGDCFVRRKFNLAICLLSGFSGTYLLVSPVSIQVYHRFTNCSPSYVQASDCIPSLDRESL